MSKHKLQDLIEAEGKKFKCPTCKTYSLEIWTEKAAYCRNGFGHSIDGAKVIDQILEGDDFKGHYDMDLSGII